MSAETVELPKDFNEWLNENDTKVRLHRCADEVVQVFCDDLSFRVPRPAELRSNQFEAWRAQYRERLTKKLASAMQEAFTDEFSSIANKLRPNTIKALFLEHIWPLVEDDFVAYVENKIVSFAVEGITIPWVRNHLGTAIVVGHPVRCGERLMVPLSMPGSLNPIGVVALDLDGNILESETTSRNELLAAVNG